MKVNFKSIHFMDKSSMDKFRWRLRSLEYSLHTCINSRLSPLQCSVSLVLFSPPRPSLSIPLSLHFFLHPVSQDGPLVTSTDGFPAGCTGRQGSIHTVINTLFFSEKKVYMKTEVRPQCHLVVALCWDTKTAEICLKGMFSDTDLKWHWLEFYFV